MRPNGLQHDVERAGKGRYSSVHEGARTIADFLFLGLRRAEYA
jgi:hypothetical protein